MFYLVLSNLWSILAFFGWKRYFSMKEEQPTPTENRLWFLDMLLARGEESDYRPYGLYAMVMTFNWVLYLALGIFYTL